MNLETLQHRLFHLVKTGSLEPGTDDPYLCQAARSEQLGVLQEIIFQWRCYGLERSCILTARLLKRRGLFDETVRRFIRTRCLDPYVEEQARVFLEMLSTHPDSLIASLAQFETALTRVRAGDPSSYVVYWEYDPYAVLEALVRETPGEPESSQTLYRVVLSRALPGLFQVEMVQDEGTRSLNVHSAT